jgi:hypothetical protein
LLSPTMMRARRWLDVRSRAMFRIDVPRCIVRDMLLLFSLFSHGNQLNVVVASGDGVITIQLTHRWTQTNTVSYFDTGPTRFPILILAPYFIETLTHRLSK